MELHVLQLSGQTLHAPPAVTYLPSSHSLQTDEEAQERQSMMASEHLMQVLGEAEVSR